MKTLLLFASASALLLPVMAHPQSAVEESLFVYLSTHQITPSAYVVGKFEKHDVVFLGEDHAIKNNLDFVASLIPRLYAHGVRTLAMEFGADEDQAAMDSLVTGAKYNEQKARDMMFDYNVGWAYREYIDMPKAAWKFNRTLAKGEKPFRILNMSYVYDWTKFDIKNPVESKPKVFAKGPADEFRARIIEQEILAKGEKVLILTGTPHAFTRYKPAAFTRFGSDTIDHYDDSWLGNRLLKDYPGRIFSIMLHQPFARRSPHWSEYITPGNGVIESVMHRMGDRPIGFDLVDAEPGALPDSGEHSQGYTDFRLGQLFDGYVFLVPVSRMRGCTIDEKFFEGRKWGDVLRQLPDPDWHGYPASLKEYWKQIRGYVDLKKRYNLQ